MDKPNLIDLFNRYWQIVEQEDTPINPHVGMFYFYLIQYANAKRWTHNPFSLMSEIIICALRIRKQNFYQARDELERLGLIKYIPGNRKDLPRYEFPIKKDGKYRFASDMIECQMGTPSGTPSGTQNDTIESEMGTQSGTQNDTIMCQMGTPSGTPSGTPYNNSINTIIKNKDIKTASTKQKRKQKKASESLFADEEKKSKKKVASAPKESPPQPPTLEDVYAYFREVKAPERINEWERSAQIFFDTYAENGWLNKYNRSIVKTWRNAASKWISYREEEILKHGKRNEIKQTDKFSERRGTEPGTASRKGFKGTF